jgi:hypothetical protein
MFESVGLAHGFCFLWNPELLWLHILSDSVIALAYFLIQVALIRIVVPIRIAPRRKDIPFNVIFSALRRSLSRAVLCPHPQAAATAGEELPRRRSVLLPTKESL